MGSKKSLIYILFFLANDVTLTKIIEVLVKGAKTCTSFKDDTVAVNVGSSTNAIITLVALNQKVPASWT